MTEDGVDEVPGQVGRLFMEAIRLDMEEVEPALDRARRALRHGAGGFIVFGGALPDVARLTERLRGEADRPLWLGADLERGAGQQFGGAATLPPPAGLAAHADPEEATRVAARITALEAREAGVNWVFAPVLDLDVEPDNPIVGTRSFGADPEVVARLGETWIRACQDAGVAACAKHFPGHGRTTEDSHLAFPVVRADREVLEADLLPFRRAAPRVAGMMTAHVGYPALGAEDVPATMEPGILRGLLREEMGYEGLVISDALVMEGFGAGGATATEGWLAVRALRAGCDVLLYPGDLPQTVRTVRQAAEQDAELRTVVAEALERSRRALERFGPDGGGDGPDDGADVREEIALEARAGDLALGCVAARGEGPSAVRDRGRPLRLRVVSDDQGPGAAGGPGDAFAAELRERGWTVEAEGDGGGAGRPGQRVVLLEATPRAWKGRAALSETARREVLEALGEDGTGYLVLFGHPRILDQLGVGGACAWSSEAVMERAAARWLDGRVG